MDKNDSSQAEGAQHHEEDKIDSRGDRKDYKLTQPRGPGELPGGGAMRRRPQGSHSKRKGLA